VDNIDAKTCLEYVCSLWPKWEPDGVILDVWMRKIGGLHRTVPRFKSAAAEARMTNGFNTPSWKHVAEALGNLPREDVDEDVPEPYVHTGWWVERRDNLHLKPLLLRSGHNCTDEQLSRMAHELVTGTDHTTGLAELYHGDWIVVGPGADDWVAARRAAGDPDFEARYQAAWLAGQEQYGEPAGEVVQDESPRQTAEAFLGANT